MRTVALFLAAAASLAVVPATARAQASTDPYFEFLMARRLEAQGNAQGALAALQRAETADPKSAEIKAEIAAFHLRKSPPDREAGERAAKAALAIDEKNVEANRSLGSLYVARVDNTDRPLSPQMAEDVRASIRHFELAVAGTPGIDANLQFTLGRLYMRNAEPEKAVQAFIRAVSQNPSSALARRSLAEAYAAAGNLKGAIGTLEEVVDYVPSVARYLAVYKEKAGLFREAAQSYSMALALEPNNRDLKVSRIVTLYTAKDFSAAAAFAAEGRRQHADDPRFPRLQGRALFDAGDRGAAIAVLESMLETFQGDLPARWTLVDMYSTAGRTSDSERTLREILKLEPSNKNALNHLGYLLAVQGERLDEAISLVQRALEQEPTNGAYLDSLGWAYFRRGDLNEAQKYLAAAAEQMPENSEIQDHLGDLHARRGRLENAIQAWERALKGDGADVDRETIERKVQDARKKLTR